MYGGGTYVKDLCNILRAKSSGYLRTSVATIPKSLMD